MVSMALSRYSGHSAALIGIERWAFPVQVRTKSALVVITVI
jgi:hypothetical protein